MHLLNVRIRKLKSHELKQRHSQNLAGKMEFRKSDDSDRTEAGRQNHPYQINL